MTSLTAEETLKWNDTSANQWRRLLHQHPRALSFLCDIRDGRTVADLLQHIVAAELRYAERLHNEPVTDYADIPNASVDEIFDTHDIAMAKYRDLLENDSYNWQADVEFPTKDGLLIASRRTILFQALLHSMRHYAQLATLLRRGGINPNLTQDYLFMHAKVIERRVSKTRPA
jgi:uncharacterized damage-inducible protein DinB